MAQAKPRKLTARQLLDKFQIKSANQNCLRDMACPSCGERDTFQIEMKAVIRIHDEGTEDHEDTEWDGKSYCACGRSECPQAGLVRDFTFPGLDDLLEQCNCVEVHSWYNAERHASACPCAPRA